MKNKFEAWCIKKNKELGKDEKLYQTDKIISGIFFKWIPKLLMFVLIIALAMRGYEKYGIERTMIVISWIFIYATSLNFARINKTTKLIAKNQLEFFKKYDARKDKL